MKAFLQFRDGRRVEHQWRGEQIHYRLTTGPNGEEFETIFECQDEEPGWTDAGILMVLIEGETRDVTSKQRAQRIRFAEQVDRAARICPHCGELR